MRAGLLLLLAFSCKQEVPVTGGFREVVVDKSVRHGQQLEVVDLDQDGSPDLVVAFSLTDSVQAYLNEGVASFDPIAISGGGSIVAIDTATFDVDGDGDLDVAAAGLTQRKRFNVSAGEVDWYENPGDPHGEWITHEIARPDLTATSSKSPDLPWGATSIQAGDLDGDSIEDLVIAQRNASDERGNIFGNRISWYRNLGNRSFEGPFIVDDSLLDAVSVLITDVDADGRLDVIAGADIGQEVAWYHNEGGSQGSLQFTAHTISTAGRTFGLVFTDLDGDDSPELVSASYAPTSSVSITVFEPPAAITSSTAVWAATIVAGGFGSQTQDRPQVVAQDFDGDGSIDLAVSSSLGDLRVYAQRNGIFEKVDVRGGYLGLTGLGSADFDGDSRADIVTSTFEFGSRDRVSWWRNESFMGPR